MSGTDPPVSRPERAREWARRYVWNERIGRALIVASPAILASTGSITSGMAIDRRLSHLTAERDAIILDIGQLDQFTKEFESKELLRASFLVGLASTQADDRLKYTLDKLYRLNAAGSLRRIAAAVYPTGWQQRIAAYDALVDSDYHEAAAVQRLQTAENDVLQDARHRLTCQQAASNRLAERIQTLQARRSVLQTALNTAMYVLTILVFFFQTAV